MVGDTLRIAGDFLMVGDILIMDGATLTMAGVILITEAAIGVVTTMDIGTDIGMDIMEADIIRVTRVMDPVILITDTAILYTTAREVVDVEMVVEEPVAPMCLEQAGVM